MNNPRSKRWKQIIIGQTIVTMVILAVAGYLIVYAMGYKINFASRKIVKTGIVAMSINPKPDRIIVNGKDRQAKENVSFSLDPGTYDIVIKKDGYNDWSMSTRVEPEIVNYFKYVELFKSNVSMQELADQKKIDYLNSPNATLAENAPKGLMSNNYEIWVAEKIIARYSSPISNVTWYTDYKHIMFQQGNQIKVIDEYGKNETVLANLETEQIAKYAIGAKSTELYIYQNGKYYYVLIQ